MHFCNIREYLSTAIRTFSALKVHSSDVSKIVKNVEFENVVSKTQRSQLHHEVINFSPAELCTVEHHSKSVSWLPANGSGTGGAHHKPSQLSAVSEYIKRSKLMPRLSEVDRCLDLCFIRNKSDMCERLFSVPGYTLTKF